MDQKVNIKTNKKSILMTISIWAAVILGILVVLSFAYEMVYYESATAGDNPNPDAYMRITSTSGTANVKVYAGASQEFPNLQYKKEGTSDWIDASFYAKKEKSGTYYYADLCRLESGESALFRGDNPNGFNDISKQKYATFMVDQTFDLSGSVMSLVDNGNETKVIPKNSHGCFANLFEEKTDGMPETLQHVSGNFLPATTMADSCYRSMFKNCWHIKYGPDLNADTLAKDCYMSMFFGCSSLVEAPALDCENLAEGCYREMFSRCTGLTKAPYLPAKKLVKDCYHVMFESCRNINYIEVGFTSWCVPSGQDPTYYDGPTSRWLYDANWQGTFSCPKELEIPSYGISTIPKGWTVKRH